MLLLACLLCALAAATTQAATIQRNIRHIPVEVRYESSPDLNFKIVEERHQQTEAAVAHSTTREAKRNLDEKPQLSQEEFAHIAKHSLHEEEDALQSLDEKDPAPPSRLVLLEEAQRIVTEGLKKLRENFKPQAGEEQPDPALWETLDNDLGRYFETERNKLELKQNQGGNQTSFFQTIANGIQTVSNNVIQGFQGQNQKGNSTQGDEQPGGVAGFIGYFQGGVQNILNQFSQNQQQPLGSGNSTVLGDTGTQPPGGQGPGGFITGIFSGVQQIFQPGSQGAKPNTTQGDTGSAPQQGGPGGFFSGAINQFNQVVGSFTGQQTTAKPAVAQGDEGTNLTAAAGGGPQNPIQVIQSIGNNIGNAFTQLVQGANRPQGSEDENSSQNQNFLQQIGSNIGNAFQNIQNNFRPSTDKPAVEGADGGGGSNPVGQISGAVQNVGNQFQQLVGQQPGANPIETIQAAIPGGAGGGKNPGEEQPEEKPEEESAKNEEPSKPNEDASQQSAPAEEKKEEPAKVEAAPEPAKKEEIMMAQE